MSAIVRERDLVIPALRAASGQPNGEISTTALIDCLIKEFGPDGHDAETIDGRNDTFFSQKVRNLISHRNAKTSMFSRAYAIYHSEHESISITEAGRNFLDQVPTE